MQAELTEAWYEMEELAVMGIVEVLGRLRRLLHIRADLTKRFGEQLKPDVFVGDDAPDFLLLKVTSKSRVSKPFITSVRPSGRGGKRVFKNDEPPI